MNDILKWGNIYRVIGDGEHNKDGEHNFSDYRFRSVKSAITHLQGIFNKKTDVIIIGVWELVVRREGNSLYFPLECFFGHFFKDYFIRRISHIQNNEEGEQLWRYKIYRFDEGGTRVLQTFEGENKTNYEDVLIDAIREVVTLLDERKKKYIYTVE